MTIVVVCLSAEGNTKQKIFVRYTTNVGYLVTSGRLDTFAQVLLAYVVITGTIFDSIKLMLTFSVAKLSDSELRNEPLIAC